MRLVWSSLVWSGLVWSGLLFPIKEIKRAPQTLNKSLHVFILDEEDSYMNE
jgi:hypothetical protein